MAHALGYLRAFVPLLTKQATRSVALRVSAAMIAMGWFSIVHAQTSSTPPVVRFTVFSAKPIEGLSVIPRAGASPQKLQFFPTARSARLEYRGPMPLRFVDANSGAVVAEANIPSGIADVFLLFAASETPAGATPTALRYQISVLDDGAIRHGPGGLAMINLSGLALSGTVNNEKVTLKPGLSPTLTIGGSAKIAFSTMFKNRPYQAYAGAVTLGRTDRALLILFPPFYKGSLEVQSRVLIDQPPGTAAAKPPVPKR